MKKCSKCKVEKPFEEFCKQKIQKDGFYPSCKSCKKKHYEENKEKIAKGNKIYYEENKKIISEKSKKYRQNNKQILKEKAKKYREENKELKRESDKKYRNKLKELGVYKDKKQAEYIKNKEKYKLREKNRIRDYKKEYSDLRKCEIRTFKYKTRNLIYGAFKRGTNQFKKNSNTETILGCTIEEFRVYIQSKFTNGMTFENNGEWHLDHIIPLATATTEEEIIKLNHYTNFQPLWAEENLSKGDKIIERQLKLI
jgi:hypothetical protein